MQWIIAVIVVIILSACLPWVIAVSKRSARKGRFGGAVVMIGMAFATVFDAPKAAAVEEIDKRKDLGDTEAGEGGELLD